MNKSSLKEALDKHTRGKSSLFIKAAIEIPQTCFYLRSKLDRFASSKNKSTQKMLTVKCGK